MTELLVEKLDGRVLLLRLNRPSKRNALSTPLLSMVAEVMAEAETDPVTGVVVITGGDNVFAAGADLDELEQATSADELRSQRFIAWESIRACTKPVVSAVEGWCLGAGFELVMRTDLVVAGDGAKFGQPETNLGIMPGAGGTSILPRLVGRSLAMEMVLTGEPINAEQAFKAGLVARVVQSGKALETAVNLASVLASRAPAALRAAKSSLLLADTLSLDDHLFRERELFVSLMSTYEKAEGINALRSKRQPRWLPPQSS